MLTIDGEDVVRDFMSWFSSACLWRQSCLFDVVLKRPLELRLDLIGFLAWVIILFVDIK